MNLAPPLARFRPFSLWLHLLLVFLAAPLLVRAEVSRVEITSRTDVGDSGYEKIVGRLHFSLDPTRAQNRLISYLEFAPMSAAGRVEFSADLYILRPKTAAASNGAALVEVSNRGGKSLLNNFNRGGKNDPVTAADLGDGFLTKQGFTLVWVGWEFDVPATPGLIRLEAPDALHHGRPLTATVGSRFVLDAPASTYTVTDLAAYPPIAEPDPAAELAVLPSRTSGERTVLPRAAWQLSNHLLTLAAGFQPGLLYEFTYTSSRAPIAGLGFAAIRDTAAWLKHGSDTLPALRYAYAYGMSQSGRFLRDFLYHGFNTDEHDRAAYDGVLAHIAGAARIDFNRRGSVPRGQGLYPVTGFPFADSAQLDPVTGLHDGLLENPRVTHAPKIFYTNTSVEYVGGGRVAALVHADPAGKQDLTLPANVRAYAFAGTQHGPARFPPAAPTIAQERANPADYWWFMRALVPAMHQWVSAGTPPPASVYPKFSDSTLVPASALAFPAIPGVASPRTLAAGPRAANPLLAAHGGAGAPLPLYVAQVDADGNERGALRLPEVTVPLATYTGWNFRAPAAGSPSELVALAGSWIPFPATRAAREASRDPRSSIEERYPTRDAYLAQVEQAAQSLVRQRVLLAPDVPAIVRQAGTRWDWLISPQPAGK